MKIPFHKPTIVNTESLHSFFSSQKEILYKESNDTRAFFKNQFTKSFCFQTNSCSSALEIAIRSMNIGVGDEVIIPGYSYVAVANAVVYNNATPVYADVYYENGNIDLSSIKRCLTNKTKAVIVIHYAGNPCAIQAISQFCRDKNIYLIEDAAQAIGSTIDDIPLGSFGDIGCLSFDYMKNISCGQGGLLIVNNKALLQNIQTIFDNGTNRDAYLKGTTPSFQWIGIGGNIQINPIASHFLAFQLEAYNEITRSRIEKWNLYYSLLTPLENDHKVTLPKVAPTHNGHIFYLITATKSDRQQLRQYLRSNGISSEQHYSSLSASTYGKQFMPHDSAHLLNSNLLCHQLLRLPIYHEISSTEILYVANKVIDFYTQQHYF